MKFVNESINDYLKPRSKKDDTNSPDLMLLWDFKELLDKEGINSKFRLNFEASRFGVYEIITNADLQIFFIPKKTAEDEYWEEWGIDISDSDGTEILPMTTDINKALEIIKEANRNYLSKRGYGIQ
jgi:hypothetical protein